MNDAPVPSAAAGSAGAIAGDAASQRHASVAAVSTPDLGLPRKLKRKRGRAGLWSILIVPVIPHFWVGLGLLGFAFGATLFPFVAKPVTGHVVGKHVEKVKNGHSYELDVAYELDGHSAKQSLNTSSTAFNDANDGDEVPLVAARIAGMDHAQRPNEVSPAFPLVPMALFWNAIVGMFVWLLAGRPLLQWWLMRNGTRVAGVVAEHRYVGGKGAHEEVVIRFGAEGITAKHNIPPTVWRASGLQSMSPVTVFHHPTKLKRCVVGELAPWDVVG
jgi:hypothetical protein